MRKARLDTGRHCLEVCARERVGLSILADITEELGQIAKPPVEGFKTGRRLFFVPIIYGSREAPPEYLEIYRKYWNQVEEHISNLELKLGRVSRVYHELVSAGGEDGAKAVAELNEQSHQIVKNRLERGAELEATEEGEILAEFMNWSKCLLVGLQSQKVFTYVYESYAEAGKKRSEYISRHIDETLKADEIGLVLMREGHQVQFPSDVQVFYVAPPALDEINRWLRDREPRAKPEEG